MNQEDEIAQLCETHEGTLEALASDGRNEAEEESKGMKVIDIVWDPDRFTMNDLFVLLLMPDVQMCQLYFDDAKWHRCGFKSLYTDDILYVDIEAFVEGVNERRGEGTAHIEVKEVFTE